MLGWGSQPTNRSHHLLVGIPARTSPSSSLPTFSPFSPVNGRSPSPPQTSTSPRCIPSPSSPGGSLLESSWHVYGPSAPHALHLSSWTLEKQHRTIHFISEISSCVKERFHHLYKCYFRIEAQGISEGLKTLPQLQVIIQMWVSMSRGSTGKTERGPKKEATNGRCLMETKPSAHLSLVHLRKRYSNLQENVLRFSQVN